MNKKANVLDLILTPTFTTIVALGIVLLIILTNVNKVGNPEEQQRRYHAINTAFTIEALQTLPKGTNAKINYFLPKDYELNIQPQKITILKDTPTEFYYTNDPIYTVETADKLKGQLTFTKTGNTITTKETQQTTYYCEPEPNTLKYEINNKAKIGEPITTGDLTITTEIQTGTPQIKLYINPTTQQTACKLAQQLEQAFKTNTQIIPINPELLPENDPRQTTQQNSIHIQLIGIPDESITLTKILTAVKNA